MRVLALSLAGLLALPVHALLAQNLAFGGVLGANLTPNFQPFYSATGIAYTNTHTLLAGVEAEWSFAGAISIEADGLYRRLHELGIPPSAFSIVTWEFPILAKCRFPRPRFTPFLEAGPSFRATGNLNDIHPSHYGFTAGFGIERQVGRLRLETAVRYTHWAADLHSIPSDIRTSSDQLELLVGFRAPSLSNTRPFGAHLSLGAVAGTNLTGDFATVSSSQFPAALANSGITVQPGKETFVDGAGPRSFLAGPLAAWELPKRFSVEVEAVYRPLRSYVQAFLSDGRQNFTYQDHRSTWEFPILARHRWRIGRGEPFIELGPTFRLLQDVYGAEPYGIAAGAGVETRAGRLKIAPGMRFTHWARSEPAAPANPRRGEVAVLTAFSF
jgi:hypothetical protein